MTVALLVCFALLLGGAFLFAPKNALGQRPLISVYNIILVLCVFYLLLSCIIVVLDGYSFVWAPGYGGQAALDAVLELSTVAVAGFLVAYHAVQRREHFPAGEVAVQEDPVETAQQHRLAVVLVVLGALLKLYVVYKGGGFRASSIRLSGGVSASVGTTALSSTANTLRTLSEIGDVGATWLLIEALNKRRPVRYWAVIFVVIEALSFFEVGKRLVLLLPIFAVILAVHHYRRPLLTRALPAFFMLAVAFGLLSLMVRIFLPASVAGAPVQVSQVSYAHNSVTGFYFNSLEFSSAQMIGVNYEDGTAVKAPFGGSVQTFVDTNFEPLLYAVPHQLWKGKPKIFYDVGYSISVLFNGGSIQQPMSGGYISTVVGVGALYGGYIGAVFSMGVLGLLSRRADRRLQVREWMLRDVLLYALILSLAFQAFRQGTIGWTIVNGLIDQLGFLLGTLAVLALGRGQLRRRRVAHPPSAYRAVSRDSTISVSSPSIGSSQVAGSLQTN